MRSMSDGSRKTGTRKAQAPADLLGIWLDLFNRYESPTRRAAKLRRTQCPRRPLKMRSLPLADASIATSAPAAALRTTRPGEIVPGGAAPTPESAILR
jgi:hypothetical protein